MKEILTSIRQHLFERINSPFYGPFVIAWVGWNHRYLLILASDGPVEWRFQLGMRLIYSDTWQIWWHALLGPLLSSIGFILLAPWINRALFAYTYWLKLKQKTDRDRLDKNQTLTVEESKYVMEQALKAQNESQEAQGTITQLGREIQSLRTQLKSAGARQEGKKEKGPASPTSQQELVSGTVKPSRSTAPVIVAQPGIQFVIINGTASFAVDVHSELPCKYQWFHDGNEIEGATERQLVIPDVLPQNAGVYNVRVESEVAAVESEMAVLGILANERCVGSAQLVAEAVQAPNGNSHDMILMTGNAATITASPGRISLISLLDQNDDIIHIEFSGAGSLSVVLDEANGPESPTKYNQPGVTYMKGRAGLTLMGTDESTQLSIYAVGKATTFDPTGEYNYIRPPSSENNPKASKSSLFSGHQETKYDGYADVGFVAIIGSKFGGLRAANARFSAPQGLVGIYAKGVHFTGPVFIGDIEAAGSARPMFVLGAASDVRVVGGDLAQKNDRPVEVSGTALIKFIAGSDAHGNPVPAQKNRAKLIERNRDVTARLILPEDRV